MNLIILVKMMSDDILNDVAEIHSNLSSSNDECSDR